MAATVVDIKDSKLKNQNKVVKIESVVGEEKSSPVEDGGQLSRVTQPDPRNLYYREHALHNHGHHFPAVKRAASTYYTGLGLNSMLQGWGGKRRPRSPVEEGVASETAVSLPHSKRSVEKVSHGAQFHGGEQSGSSYYCSGYSSGDYGYSGSYYASSSYSGNRKSSSDKPPPKVIYVTIKKAEEKIASSREKVKLPKIPPDPKRNRELTRRLHNQLYDPYNRPLYRNKPLKGNRHDSDFDQKKRRFGIRLLTKGEPMWSRPRRPPSRDSQYLSEFDENDILTDLEVTSLPHSHEVPSVASPPRQDRISVERIVADLPSSLFNERRDRSDARNIRVWEPGQVVAIKRNVVPTVITGSVKSDLVKSDISPTASKSRKPTFIVQLKQPFVKRNLNAIVMNNRKSAANVSANQSVTPVTNPRLLHQLDF